MCRNLSLVSMPSCTLQALREKIKPHFLRRMKREIFPSLLSGDAPVVTKKGPNCPPRLPLKHDLIVWLQLALRQVRTAVR